MASRRGSIMGTIIGLVAIAMFLGMTVNSYANEKDWENWVSVNSVQQDYAPSVPMDLVSWEGFTSILDWTRHSYGRGKVREYWIAADEVE